MRILKLPNIGFYLFLGLFFTIACNQPPNKTVDNKTTETVDSTQKAPLIEKYTAQNRARSGIALGGLGTGSVELRKDGQFYNWSIFNNYPLGCGPVFSIPQYPRDGWEEALQFFIVRYQEKGGDVKLKLLQINQSINEAGMESIDYYYPWLSAVENIEYSARFPYVRMKFYDDDMPFVVSLEAFSPFIPHDVKNSSLPGVYFNFKIESTSDKEVDVMLIASQRNLVGYDQTEKYFITELKEGNGYKFFNQTVGGMDTTSSTYGQMGMASISDATTYYLGWEHKHPYYENLLFYNTFKNVNDTKGRNSVDKTTNQKRANMGFRVKDQRSFSSMAITKKLSPKQAFKHTYLMTWYFPNAYGSHNAPKSGNLREGEFYGDYIINQKQTKIQGHYYNNFFQSANDVADYLIQNKADIHKRTKEFVDNFYASDADQFVLDQINSNLNTFITSSTLTKDMKFAIREGMTPDKSWGPNATIDVSLYGSVPIAALFPELQKNMMRCHKELQTPEGEINHGLGYDLDFTQNGTWGVYHRIDMPGNYIQLVLRDYFWTNDKEYLSEMWPSIKQAIEYVLNERDKDKDMMPDMKGIMCSYDNFPMYGLSSYIQSQWLCAIKGAMEAAKVMNDTEAEQKYKEIFTKGSELMDKHLWNGEYYRLSSDYSGLCNDMEKAVEKDDACMTDQIIGQWMADMCGLGYLFKKEHVQKSLQNIMKMSFKKGFGLRNCSWPEHPGLFPIHTSDLWVDQANTPWSGVELAFASFLIYQGYYSQGLEVIKEVDNRYRKANLYWDHQEFGGHYYRPMSAWAIVNSLLGLSIHCGEYHFAPKITKENYKLFFAFSNGTAHFIKSDKKIMIKVLTGTFQCNQISLKNLDINTQPKLTIDEKNIEAQIHTKEKKTTIDFKSEVVVQAGETLIIE